MDNYGQNIIAFGGIALVTTLIHFGLLWALKSSRVKGKVRQVLFIIRKYYGPMFLVAKLDANHLEIILFTLINYSITSTSSSKWIVGVVLSSLLFAGLLCLAGLVTFTNFQIFKLRKGTHKVLPVNHDHHNHGHQVPLDTEVQAIDSGSGKEHAHVTHMNMCLRC